MRKIYNIEDSEFTHCCGASELGGFPEDLEIEDAEADYKEQVAEARKDFNLDKKEGYAKGKFNPDAYVDKRDFDTREAVLDEIISNSRAPLVTATTLVKNQSIAGKMLRKAGFKDVLHFLGNSGNELILWAKVNRPAPKKANKPSKKGSK